MCTVRVVRWLLLVGLFGLAVAPAGAQGYSVTLTQIDTAAFPEITVYVNVTNAAGQQVLDLTQANFTVREEGQAVSIVDFAGLGQARPVDIVFVFDTTGSMDQEIEGVKQTAIEFAEKLEAAGRDFRLGLVSFTDRVEQQFNPDGTLTDDAAEFQDWVGELVANGGGDTPENDYAALKTAGQMGFRPGAQVIFILITDAPPHHFGDPPDDGQTFEDSDLTLERILELLRLEGITVYAIADSSLEYSQLTDETGGNFYDIATNPDFTGIIDDIGNIIANQYKITYHTTRPVNDGTRRDIEIEVQTGEVSGSGTADYLEKHFINIESDWVIGLLLLVPLLMALLVPVVFMSRPVAQPLPPAPSPPPYPPPPTAFVANAVCPACQQAIRPGAQFCSHCGHKMDSRCPHCQTTLRPGARFCPSCGQATIEL